MHADCRAFFEDDDALAGAGSSRTTTRTRTSTTTGPGPEAESRSGSAAGISRRAFLVLSAAATGLWTHEGIWAARRRTVEARARIASADRESGAELAADVVVLGGGTGGTAAALAAARLGRRVILTEPTDWIGGQLTQQGVPPDEHPWIESFGCTRSYRSFRDGVRDYYRRSYPLTAAARARPHLDPGNGWVSALCHEPRVGVAILHELAAPFLSRGLLTILHHREVVDAEVDGDRVRAVAVRDTRDGAVTVLVARYFIDATELGDLLPAAGVEHVSGSESREQTGELHASSRARPDNHQACTWCFAVEHRDGEDHRIDRPEDYDSWRDFVPELEPPWPGKLLSFEYSDPRTLAPRRLGFDPRAGASGGFWAYRRILDRENFAPGTYAGDVSLINWPMNDYLPGNLFGGTSDDAARHRRGARQLSLALLYWLQTEAPRPDGGAGWPGLRLRGDMLGTEDGLAKHVYVRESRRIVAEFTVLEQHVAASSDGDDREARFDDSVGIGSYRIDLHPSTGGDNYIDIGSLPFQIPLGALIPRRVENVLAGAKNLGVTHVTNGCYRLHPVEWNIGEAAGLLAAFALERTEPPRRVRGHGPLLVEFQRLLRREGVELEWPRARPR